MTVDLQRIVELEQVEKHGRILKNEDKMMVRVWEHRCEKHIL